MRLAARRSVLFASRHYHVADLSTPLAPVAAASAPASVDTGLKHTKTSSGLEIITVDAASPYSAATVTFRAGSRYEDSLNHGAAAQISHLLFAGNASGDSSVASTRSLLQSTTDRYARSSRETLSYSMEFTREKMDQVVQQLAHSVQPLCRNWEVNDSRDSVDAEYSMVDAAMFAAFRGSPLARSEAPSEPGASEVDLAAYRDALMTRSNAVIVGSGVEHEAFVTVVESAFANLAEGSGRPESAATTYVGGESHSESQGSPQFVLAVPVNGGLGSREFLTASVLQEVFGRTPSRLFTKPRPGDGMASRLAKRFESEAGVMFAESFVTAYSDAALFGFEIQAIEGEEGAILKAVAAEFVSLSTKAISDSELAGAKRRLKTSVLAGSESVDLHAHFLARQALFTNKVLDRAEYIAQIDSISAADVTAFVKAAIKAGPTLVSEGSSANYKPVAKIFK